jgi:polyisoprenoid-binding protein YceI
MMRKISVAVVGLVGLAAVAGYEYFKPPALATGPIEAVAIESTADTQVTATAPRFEIQPAESEARFVIDEVLQGAPKTVVGTTDQVAGQIAFDPADADAAQVGAILVNARTLATDSTQRDRAIQNWVLQTETYEYVSFTPTQLAGLPETMQVGEAVTFQIVGDLTIRDVTRQATFEATVTPIASDQLEGTATTTIRYADWGISIPQVPMVASVSDQLGLQLDFVATAPTAANVTALGVGISAKGVLAYLS